MNYRTFSPNPCMRGEGHHPSFVWWELESVLSYHFERITRSKILLNKALSDAHQVFTTAKKKKNLAW